MTNRPEGTVRFSCAIKGLDCPDCASKIEKQVLRLRGIQKARVNIIDSRLEVLFDQAQSSPGDIEKAVRALGYGVEQPGGEKGRSQPPRPANRLHWVLTSVAGLFILLGVVGKSLSYPESFSICAYLLAIVLAGPPTFKKGFLAIRHRNLDMNFLMSIAVIGAMAIGEWIEGASVILLFSLANLLESLTISKARKAIEAILDLSPEMATVRRDGGEAKVPVEEVKIDERVLIKPGERIPVDGRIASGASSVDQSPITGESTPVRKEEGSTVFAGTINGRGFLEVIVEKNAEDTTLARILHMVEEAQAQKAPAQHAVDRFSRIYTPLVVATAILIALVPPLAFRLPFDVWFYRALVLLVVACPCALVISTPVTIISGLASAARQGILIKGGIFLEQTAHLKAIAFDKTGTVTYGQPVVTGIHRYNETSSDSQLLKLAAALEVHSEHPLAEAILKRAAHDGIAIEEPAEFLSLPGEGVKATLDGKAYYAGNHRLFEEMGLCSDHLHEDLLRLEGEGETVILIGSNRELLGAITLEDRVRPGIEDTLKALREAGIRHLVMLTGDNRETAEGIARRIGMDAFRAEQLPQDKVAAIQELKARYGTVAMVGDGINDAPALATAHVGIAMGVMGSDATIETADIALMSDDLASLPTAFRLSRKALRIIRENIAFSLVTKGIFLALAPLGFVTLWMAVVADMGASLLVIFNGLRLLSPEKRRERS